MAQREKVENMLKDRTPFFYSFLVCQLNDTLFADQQESSIERDRKTAVCNDFSMKTVDVP